MVAGFALVWTRRVLLNWIGVICDCHPVNGDDDLCEEKEEDDKVQPVVKMRVKASRTSEVKLLLLGY